MSRPVLSNTIELKMGDWSGDGHRETESLFIKTNFSLADIKSAYKDGTRRLTFDFVKEVAADYEDSILSSEQYADLKQRGLWRDDKDVPDFGSVHLGAEEYADIYLFIVKLGASEFEWEWFAPQTINIGGYGLFGS